MSVRASSMGGQRTAQQSPACPGQSSDALLPQLLLLPLQSLCRAVRILQILCPERQTSEAWLWSWLT